MSASKMYSSDPGLVIGFHGCDMFVRDQIIQGKDALKPSANRYDWLGPGMYFWQNNYERALDFAQNPPGRMKIEHPAVLGAVFSLGNCLDLTDKRFIDLLKRTYNWVREIHDAASIDLPQNKNAGLTKDRLLRELDCLIINYLHIEQEVDEVRPFDTVRGVFIEGAPIYEGAGFNEKTHMQICVCNPNCIKGFFLPREESPWPALHRKST